MHGNKVHVGTTQVSHPFLQQDGTPCRFPLCCTCAVSKKFRIVSCRRVSLWSLMESKERRGNFSHIQKDIIRTKRDGYSFARKGFPSEKMQKSLPFGHQSRKFLVQEVKVYPSQALK